MSYLRCFATVALVSSSIAIGCRPPDVQPDPNATHPLRASAEVYTLVNLHPDDDRELSSVNYLDDEELLPLCTPIRVSPQAPPCARIRRLSFSLVRSRASAQSKARCA